MPGSTSPSSETPKHTLFTGGALVNTTVQDFSMASTPNSDGLQPNSGTSNLLAMAFKAFLNLNLRSEVLPAPDLYPFPTKRFTDSVQQLHGHFEHTTFRVSNA